ncbi:uncharacterized protein LOC115216761 [Argonauta hians]
MKVNSAEDFAIPRPDSSITSGVAAIFLQRSKLKESCIGVTMVRGIRCYQWRSTYDDNGIHFEMDWYIADPDWISTFDKPLVRYHVTGNTTGKLAGSSFEYYYDFFQFRRNLDGLDNIFEMPPGVLCDGAATKLMPVISNIFSAYMVYYDENTKNLVSVKQSFDRNFRLSKKTYDKPTEKSDSSNSFDVIINDFNESAMAGLGVGMCLLGLLLTALIVKMNLKCFIFVLCLSLCHIKYSLCDDDCKISPSTEGAVGPQIKLPDQIYFHLRATFLDKKETTSFVEYYDHVGSRGVLTQKEHGDIESFYYSFNTNEMFTVHGTQCVASDLSSNQNELLMGKTENGTSVMISPARMLFFQNRGTYMGTKRIRGIPCYHFFSCQTWKAFGADMKVNWYFAADNLWSTAQSSDYHIPVRCDVEGISHETQFHHIYDYFHFRSGLPDDTSIFETPEGIICPGRKITKQLPEVPSTMAFYTEIVTEKFATITSIKEEYDHLAYLAKFTYTALPLYQKFSSNQVVEIHDFLTGVAYVTDTVTGDCQARPIPHSNLDSKDLNPHEVRMATAKQFFDFPTDKYSYEGIGNTAKSSQVVMAKVIPIKFDVHLPDESYHFNIYSFSDMQPKLSGYDISNCFIKSRREKFALSITNQAKLYIVQNTALFKFYVISSVSGALQIRPVRVQKIQIKYGEEELYLTFEIVGIAPILGDIKDRAKEKPLTQAVNELKNLLKNKKFVIQVYTLPTNGKFDIVPTEMTLDEVEYKIAKKTTYSKGAMAGLGFGMTILGFIIVFLIAMKVL